MKRKRVKRARGERCTACYHALAPECGERAVVLVQDDGPGPMPFCQEHAEEVMLGLARELGYEVKKVKP